MGIGSRRRPAASRSVADLSTAANGHRYPDDDDFEFTPLLSYPRRGGSSSAATECPPRRTAQQAATEAPRSERAPASASASAGRQESSRNKARGRRQPVRWHELAFGSARVAAAMDMAEIRRRLQAPRRDAADVGEAWAPWRLIRSLSCRGVEAVAVAAAASASAPVRLA